MKTLRIHQVEAVNSTKNINEGIIHLPTGTGKTLIQSSLITKGIIEGRDYNEKHDIRPTIPVFVTLAPRIMLSNQLFNVVKEELQDKKLDCQYLIVHSGKTDNDQTKFSKDLPYRQLKSTTRSKDIIEEYERASRENVPLVIFGTYDSSKRIVDSEIPIYMLLCDEAQYLVSERFGWIPYENEINEIDKFDAVKKYYFTATLKETISDKGIGMNNSDLFGPIIYHKTPLEMIIAGEMVRPRIHLVDVSDDQQADDLSKDVNAIINGFIEHRAQCNIGAKLLIVTKGSKHLNQIVTHPRMQNFLSVRPNLKIFDISSAYQPRINGIVVKRGEFLKSIQGMSDTDDAIILHIDILSEGIDVPGITGVMPMNNMGLSKFLQTLGRATRLHPMDREKLYSGILLPDNIIKFIKPYSWVIVPVYNTFGEDLKENILNIIYSLRESGFNASEDVFIKENRGSTMPKPLKGINNPDTKAKALFDIIVDVTNEIEAKEIADKLELEDYRMDERIKNMTPEEKIHELSIL